MKDVLVAPKERPVSTFVSVRPLDIFDETSKHLPAVFVATKLDFQGKT